MALKTLLTFANPFNSYCKEPSIYPTQLSSAVELVSL